jgi:hypothetical protein
MPLVVLAQAQLALGVLDSAAENLDEAAQLAHSGALTWVLRRVAEVSSRIQAPKGELPEVESLAHEALTLGREAGDRLGVVDALELLARLAEQGSAQEAVRLWAAADSGEPNWVTRVSQSTARRTRLPSTRPSRRLDPMSSPPPGARSEPGSPRPERSSGANVFVMARSHRGRDGRPGIQLTRWRSSARWQLARKCTGTPGRHAFDGSAGTSRMHETPGQRPNRHRTGRAG